MNDAWMLPSRPSSAPKTNLPGMAKAKLWALFQLEEMQRSIDREARRLVKTMGGDSERRGKSGKVEQGGVRTGGGAAEEHAIETGVGAK